MSRVQTSIKKPIEGTFKTLFFTGLKTSIKLKNKVLTYGQDKKTKLLNFKDIEEDHREWYSVQFAETEIFQLSDNYSRILSLEDGTFVKR